MDLLLEHYNTFNEMYSPDTICGRERVLHLTRLVRKHAKLPRNALVLDAGCGSGVSSLAVAKNGYRVIGMDIRPESCVEARYWFRKRKFKGNFLCGDLRKIPLKSSSLDGALFLFNPIPHWSMDDFFEIAVEVLRVLKPGGMCMLEFLDTVELIFTGKWRETMAEYVDNKCIISIHHCFDTASGTTTRSFIDFATGKNYVHKLHLCSEWIIDFIFRRAGFGDVKIVRQETQSPRKVMIAIKPIIKG